MYKTTSIHNHPQPSPYKEGWDIKPSSGWLGLLFVVIMLSLANTSWCAEIIILGDTQLKPVAEVIAGIRKTVHSSPKIIAPADVKGSFSKTVAAEDAKVVIALGKEAVEKALQLPSNIPVICSLVIAPPKSTRPNFTCGLMATPVSEYLNFIRQYFPVFKKVAVVSSPEIQRSMLTGFQGQLAVHQADTSFEFISKIRQLNGVDALLLLPDVSVLTSTALDEVYLHSFRHKVPVFGVSEKHVKQGSLFALVFDTQSIGRQLGEKAIEALSGADLAPSQSFTARKFNVYLNTDTAQKMGVVIPDELLRRAKKVYP